MIGLVVGALLACDVGFTAVAALASAMQAAAGAPQPCDRVGIAARFQAAAADIADFLADVHHREMSTSGWDDIPLADLRAIETIWFEIGRLNEANRPIPEIARLARTGLVLMGDVPQNAEHSGTRAA